MSEKLLQHVHCVNCGLAVQADEKYCDSDCKEEHKEMLKKKRKSLLTLYVGSIVVIIVLVFISMGSA
jgi:predicted nucleic acid-binding Zn ribbon protein